MTVPISRLKCGTLQHPEKIAANREADSYAFWNVFYSDKVKISWQSRVCSKLAKIKSLLALDRWKPAMLCKNTIQRGSSAASSGSARR